MYSSLIALSDIIGSHKHKQPLKNTADYNLSPDMTRSPQQSFKYIIADVKTYFRIVSGSNPCDMSSHHLYIIFLSFPLIYP